jgi:hypothetical protein
VSNAWPVIPFLIAHHIASVLGRPKCDRLTRTLVIRATLLRLAKESCVISRRYVNTFRPCLPAMVMQAPTDERWAHEIKHDGFRISPGGSATMYVFLQSSDYRSATRS